MFHLHGTPRRAPFSDWCARVERKIERETGQRFKIARDSRVARGYYDVGLTPDDMADDFIQGQRH
jgi:hypothetical protein